MKKTVLALLSLTLFAPIAASAKPYHFTPVNWIVETRNNLNEDDKYVTIIGHVTRRISDEEYWFTDGTGSIRLDSENFDLPIGRRIVIGGRIDQAYLDIGHVEVDVRRWHYAPLPKKVTAPLHSAPVARTVPPPPETAPRQPAGTPASSLAPSPEPAPAPVTTTPPAPPAAPPTPTTSTTMNPSTVPATPAAVPSTEATNNAPAK